jgi:hypothetical protein
MGELSQMAFHKMRRSKTSAASIACMFTTLVLGEAMSFDVSYTNPPNIALTYFLFQFVMAIPFSWLRDYINDRCYGIRYSWRGGPSPLA